MWSNFPKQKKPARETKLYILILVVFKIIVFVKAKDLRDWKTI
jgi:hypothetical protein